ncbi:MAG TPA: SCP2 sterol-binding domain-containing protein [Acidimicrobiia bacterium]|nr:SCP2 sterol-binding domain-containing protein [Acidimicrobiia bacterium]
MAKFLTHDWLQALNDTVNKHEGFRKAIATVDLTLQFEVPDAPDGTEGRYFLAIKDGALVAGPGDATAPDATITNSYETATAISKGTMNTQMAFMTGKMKVAGNMAKIMMNQAVFNSFADAASGVAVEY